MLLIKRYHISASAHTARLLIQWAKRYVVVLRLRIKEVAQEKGISMTKLSQRSEVGFTTVRLLFKDPYRSVTTDTLERLAKVLGVSPLDLLEYIPGSDTR